MLAKRSTSSAFSTISSIPSVFGSFRRVDTQLNTTGAVLHMYERAGGLKYGEVEVGQETVIFDSESSHHTGDGEEEAQ